MPYHYGAGSSDVEWWPDGNEDGNQGDEAKSQAPQSWSSSPSDDGWNYDVRDIAATSMEEWHNADAPLAPLFCDFI
ncbi:hypothetical protein BT96DRAFT_987538 [Gymnopus androsaceus JB14]|uniref:Uncharacterized protein n=1 Tax=Gymnopus androsaceus JB14 TaxID=1447944 RepID=A0A6A4IC77_9AGAR|nr:hypothetical protein BT96DRAFT_987538 [Gymnopus androsaceus JB14]